MKMLRLKLAVAALTCACLASLAGCHWPDADDEASQDDFTQKALEKHHENGEMNDYQYQQSMKELPPVEPAAPGASGASSAAPAAATTTAP
jgi:hypothetical protein